MSNKPSPHDEDFQITTLGCRLNLYESEKIKTLAKKAGVQNTTLINSCAVTKEAIRQSRQAVRKAKRKNPHHQIILTGCAAKIANDQFLEMKEIDRIVDNHQKMDDNLFASATPHPSRKALLIEKQTRTIEKQTRTRAMLKIQDGCDWHCTFCIIPQGRGKARSLDAQNIVEEARALYHLGHREITLTGVDIASYGVDIDKPASSGESASLSEPASLGELTQYLLSHTPQGLKFKFSSLDPAAIDARLFELLASEERLLPHIHLSAQAGDNMILKRMRRRHNREQMIQLCANLRKRRAIIFGADLIAGFPTESDAMFANSIQLIDDCDILFAHIFPFSPHFKTPAAHMPQIAPATIRERARILRQKAENKLIFFLKSQINSTQKTLAETPNSGRTANNIPVQWRTQVKWRTEFEIGKYYQMKIKAVEGQKLIGEPV